MEHHRKKGRRNSIEEENLEKAVADSDSAIKELELLDAFTLFLKSSKNLQSIIAELELKEFCGGGLSFNKFINNIKELKLDTYSETLINFQEAAEDLNGEDELLLVDKFKKVLGAYIKPIDIHKRKIDNRLVIEVIGKNVAVSEILLHLENKLSENPNIEEVRFVVADILHIDADLKNNIWHGKNVAVLTKTIIIHGQVTWNVSGKNDNHTYSNDAGTGENGHGNQGKDGFPGESGGNILIQAKEIENSKNFTLISNGGKGSKGQDGGNGRNGEDGAGITKSDLKKKYPNVAYFNGSIISANIRKILRNIKAETLKVKTAVFGGVIYSKIEKMIESYDEYRSMPSSNIFIEAETNQGNEITFSVEMGCINVIRQGFFLYKGSLGKPGGYSGEYGLGGQGGHAGQIIVKNLNNSQEFLILKNTKQGEEGEKGQEGQYGSHGKNGWDMGYLDYQHWSETKYRYEGKYKIEYYDQTDSDRIWCSYKNKYAKIVSANIEQKKQKSYNERKNTRQNNDRQHHAHAVRKKNISRNSILDNYSHHLNSMEKNTLQDLRSDLENRKQRALQEINENQEQQKKHAMELGIKRHVTSDNKGKNKFRIDTIFKTVTDVDGLIDKLKSKLQLLDNWLQLKDIELNRFDLEELFLIFETVKKSIHENKISMKNQKNKKKSQNIVETSKLQDIERLLIEKYKLAILQDIVKQLPPYQEVTDNIELSPKRAARYLVEKENCNKIPHPILENLNEYLFVNSSKHREKISKFCKEVLKNINNEAFECSIRAFVSEAKESEKVHSSVKQYYVEYEECLDLNQEYDWEKCCNDQEVLQEYYDYIQDKGLLSESYRELLTYIFDTNIRLYIEDQENELSLLANHHPSSKKAIHVLHRANGFVELNIDENYFMLEDERKKNDKLYAKILTEIESLNQKQEFDDYLRKNFFSSDLNQSFFDKYIESQVPFINHDKCCLSEEQNIIEIIKYFPIEKEKQQLKQRLEKITSRYIGQQDILQNIQKRFSSGGRHVSFQELSLLVNSILTSVVEDKQQFNTFCWIVAAHSQRNWIDELILLQLENYFKMPLAEKPKWREYLSKINNIDILLLFNRKIDQCVPGSSISTQCVEDILYLLNKIPNETVHLKGLKLSEWPYALKERTWTIPLSKLADWQNSDLSAASYYLFSIENTFGTDLVKKFLKALEEIKQEKLSHDTLTNILSNFHDEKWILSEEDLNILNNCSINVWVQKMQKKFTANEEDRNVTQLVELIKNNANTSKEIFENLSKIADCISKKYMINGKSVDSFTTVDIEKWAKSFKNNISEERQSIKNSMEMLTVIDKAIELKRSLNTSNSGLKYLQNMFYGNSTNLVKLRDTQKLTVLALLSNDHNTLAQVNTGEGKSLIIVVASIMKALHGEKIDIITSSTVLAKRDAENYKDIYKLFGINVSHNCSEDIEERKEAYSGNQVVYGDLSNFQRDYLLDKFYGKNILGDRNYENVIVDEVDSMLLDKGNNMLYLSHDIAGLGKLESVYIYIWQWINRPARDDAGLSYAFNTNAIKEAVLNDLYGIIKKEDIEKLSSKLSERQKNVIWERLIQTGILDDKGKLLKGNINDNELDKVLSPEFGFYKHCLRYLLKECIEREKFIHVPNNLRFFIELHLESWINSAITAFFMKAGEDYVVDVDKTGTSPDRNPIITIIDRDTGTDQTNSQWDEAMHQFLQLKHGCKLSLQSLKAVFISNVSFFKLYRILYGLTGTLGSQRERDSLQELYNVDYVTIPTAKPKQFHEEKPILCTSKEEWIERIHNEAKKLTDEKKRSVLIICETVNDVETLYKAFGGTNAKHVYTYTRDYEEIDKGFEIVQDGKELGQRQIIIATNLAGRGTDIKITEGLSKAGGLHVCLTYLPNNIRIEQQAFGRTARSGEMGSGQLIIMDIKRQEYSSLKIFDLKKKRDTEELSRMSDIKAFYETQIMTEERCFKTFKEHYEKSKKDLDDNNVPTEVKEILLQSCLDKWAFWLDENKKSMKYITDEHSKTKFNGLLSNFISQFKNLDNDYSKILRIIYKHDINSWLAWVAGNPVQMVKLGRYFSQNKLHESAIKLFDEVIEKEPFFSVAAHYYKAFALIKQNNSEIQRFKIELQKATRLLDEHSKFAMIAAGIIAKIKKNNGSIIQIDAYEEQQKSLANLYSMFSRSIDDIFGHAITSQSFINHNIDKELAQVLYKDLLKEGILSKPSVKKNISEVELKLICTGYGVSVETLKDFLSEYEGQDIDEKEFKKELKDEVPLPSLNEFWKLLIEQNVLNEEVKYIAIDNEKLRKIDLSLLDFLTEMIDKRELTNQTLEINNEQIFSNAELITKQNNNGYVLIKDDFLNIVGKDKYKILKKRGTLSFNKKAHIDQNKTKSITFSRYDSITLEAFTNVDIIKSEAEIIITELVKQNVIEKRKNSENDVYGLKIKCDEIDQITLPSCPVYENAVRELLSVCFIYRVALQKIKKQLDAKDFPLRFQLMVKPHHNLIFELLEQKIIKPTTVVTENEDLEKKLKNMYSRIITKDNLKRMLSQNKFISEDFFEKLCNCLVEKKWVIKYIGTSSADLYYINSPDKRQKPLNVSPKASIDKTVENVLDNQLQLSKEDTIKNIVSTLKSLRGSLKTLEFPDGKLNSLTELCTQDEFSNIEEVRVFALNGLDQLLMLEEKKWALKMLLNTAVVIVIGVSQIVIGTVIELYSVGVMTHVGAAFINEGVSDLFYAASALSSGYFSWEDYGQHKLMSAMITVASVGIGAYFSKGVKVSRFGYKLAGPNFKYGGKKVAELCGIELIKVAGVKVTVKEFAKRIGQKALEGVVFGLTNAGIDRFVENYLQTLCESMASNILSNIEQEVEGHSISRSLEDAYGFLGEESTRFMLDNLTKNAFTEQNCLKKFLPIANNICQSLTSGIAEAANKRSRVGMKFKIPVHEISKALVWSERIAHIADIKLITNDLLNDLDHKINRRLNNMKKDVKQGQLRQKLEAKQDYASFRTEIIDQWKSLLHKQAGQIISQHIVSPVLKEGSNLLVRYVGNKIQETYESHKESGYLDKFGKRKQEYQKKLQAEQKYDGTSETKNQNKDKYHEDLRKLMVKTRNPNLFAAIVRENVPMDLTCVSGCPQVIQNILEMKGIAIPGLNIVVEGDNGMRQKFSSVPDGSESITIFLNLKDNHFEFCGSSTSENNSTETKNNCLYDALAEAIPELRDIIGPKEFRACVANCIEHDEVIQQHIQQGWHRLPINLGAFGGERKRSISRKRSKVVHDPESSPFDENVHDSEEFKYRMRKVDKHLLDRLTRFLTFEGMKQRASEQTNIKRSEIVKSGASQFQDQSSHRGNNIHASHVIRIGEINPEIANMSPQIGNELKNYSGHTHNILSYANEWHGVGGDVDRFQENNLNKLGTIDFSGSLTTESANIIRGVKEAYIALLDERINSGEFRNHETLKSDLIKVKIATKNMSIESLFKKGKKGYLGEGLDGYQK